MKYLISLLGLTMIQCQRSGDASQQSMGSQESSNEDPQIPPPPWSEESDGMEYGAGISPKIIKNGKMDIEVNNLSGAKNHIDTLISTHHSYYETEEYRTTHTGKEHRLEIRVPKDQFDALIRDIENGQGNIISKIISAEDVTEEYVDLNINLDNNLAYLGQYKKLLGRATTIKNILEIQEKSRQVEYQINRTKGRLRFMDDKINYSTLSLLLREKDKDTLSKNAFHNRLWKSLGLGYFGLLDLLIGLVRLWPLFIFIPLGWYIIRKMR